MQKGMWGLLTAAMLLATPVLAGSEALNACKSCHDLTSAKRSLMGQPLFGVYGRKPMMTDVSFAVWDDAALDQFLKNPRSVKAKTNMGFAVTDDAKRAAVIAALKELK